MIERPKDLNPGDKGGTMKKRYAVERLLLLTLLVIFSQLSCAVGKSEIECMLINQQTDKKVPARYIVRGTGPEPASYVCVDREARGCTVEVAELADYEILCYPLEAGYKLIGPVSKDGFPGNRVTFYCTE